MKKKNKIKKLAKDVKDIFASTLPIGGIEISHTSIKFLVIKNNAIVQASLRIPPGLIEHGLIKNRKQFIEALKNVHQQVAPLKKILSVVLVLSSDLIYSQAFSVPVVDREHLEESIKLNLEMNSPTDIKALYHDWQEIQSFQDGRKLDLLGAFAKAKDVENYISALKEAGFTTIATEFPGLALARLIQQRWTGLEVSQDYLLVHLDGEGLLILILKKGKLFFNHFSPWHEVFTNHEENNMEFSNIKDFLSEEMQRVLNFYLGKSGQALKEVIVISPIFQEEITKIAKEKFSLTTRNLTINELPNLAPTWFSVLGAGLRGLISRSKDIAISLMRRDVQVSYYEERTIHFIRIWRNIIIGALAFILLAFITVDTAFLKEQSRLSSKITSEFTLVDLENTSQIQTQISTFNRLLGLIETTSPRENKWSPVLLAIQDIAGSNIAVKRLFIDKNTLAASMTGQGVDEEAAISFKNRLEKNKKIKNVVLPLSNINVQNDKSATFNVSFKLDSLNF